MATKVADAGLKTKQETQRERVARVMREVCSHVGSWEDRAAAVIAAYPDPRVVKDRKAPPLPDDACSLHAKRHQFAELVDFVENQTERPPSGPAALARALVEQGVV